MRCRAAGVAEPGHINFNSISDLIANTPETSLLAFQPSQHESGPKPTPAAPKDAVQVLRREAWRHPRRKPGWTRGGMVAPHWPCPAARLAKAARCSPSACNTRTQTVLPTRMRTNGDKTEPGWTPWTICPGNVRYGRSTGTASDKSARVRAREV